MSLANNDLAIGESGTADVVSNHRHTGKLSWKRSAGGAHKKIMKVWKLLDNNLPESLFVAAYKTRVDMKVKIEECRLEDVLKVKIEE